MWLQRGSQGAVEAAGIEFLDLTDEGKGGGVRFKSFKRKR
jgi:hypothetical protein